MKIVYKAIEIYLALTIVFLSIGKELRVTSMFELSSYLASKNEINNIIIKMKMKNVDLAYKVLPLVLTL